MGAKKRAAPRLAPVANRLKHERLNTFRRGFFDADFNISTQKSRKGKAGFWRFPSWKKTLYNIFSRASWY